MDMSKGRFMLNRRAILRGLAGAAIGLPLLDAMGPTAHAAPLPKRLVVFFTPDGTIPGAWASGSVNDFTLGPILSPLEANKSNLIVLTGVNNQAAHHGPGDDHQRGMGTMLTGTELQPGPDQGGCDTCPPAGFAGGASVDQVIAQKIGNQTKLASMEYGVSVHDANSWSRMSFSGPGKPMPPVDNPKLAYTRIFGDFNADPMGAKRLAAERHLVLDSVMSDAKKLQSKVGSDDRAKIEQHLASLDGINKHLDTVGQIGGDCSLPAPLGNIGDVYDEKNHEAVGRLQMDLMVAAMACDITRVSSLQWTTSVGNTTFSQFGLTEGHHELSHHPTDDMTSQAALIKIDNFYAKQMNYLIEKMKTIKEGTGTLLDNTVILWCNELAVGNAHSHDNMHYLLAGSCGGTFKTGRYLNFKGDPHNNLLLSLCHAMGVNEDKNSFGNPAYCTGPLAGLTG
jgi:hypothetical protein